MSSKGRPPIGGVAPRVAAASNIGRKIPPPAKQISRLLSDFGLSFSFCSIVGHKVLSPTSVVQDKGEITMCGLRSMTTLSRVPHEPPLCRVARCVS
jgi:hypothetical protein